MAFDGVSFRVELDQEPLKHLDGYGDRRVLAGRASVRGIDFEDMEILPEAFKAGAEAYLKKNPVLLWDHARYLPIGRVLEIAFRENDIYITAEIFRFEEGEDGAEKIEMPKDPRFPQLQSIRAKCDEVWAMVRRGQVRGLSVAGRVRGKMEMVIDASGNRIKRAPEVLLYEISVTPIQMHPEAQIDAVNTLAKALEIAKSLGWGDDFKVLRGKRYKFRPQQKTVQINAKNLRK